MISICFWYDMGYDLDMVWECLRYDSLYGFDIWFGNGATFRGAPVGLLGKRNQKQQFDRFLVDFSKVFIVLIWSRYDFDMVLVLVWFWYCFDMILICFDMVSRHFPKNPTKPQTYRNHSFDPQQNHDFNPYDDVKITIETISTSWLQNQATTTINHTVSEYIWIISKSFKEILFEHPPSRQHQL